MTEFEALKLAVTILGSQQATAEAIGIKQQSVSDVIRGGRRAPAEWVLPIERATRGKVTRHELRPDLYPLDEDDQPGRDAPPSHVEAAQ